MSNPISAALVKELRDRTGSAMMDCKRALEQSSGDMDGAIEVLRKSGKAKADKKAGRVAAEGVVFVHHSTDDKSAVMIEVNCETDFVARDNNFLAFVKQVAQTAFVTKARDTDVLSGAVYQGASAQTVEEARQGLVATVGENVQIRRVLVLSTVEGSVGSYIHGDRIGVLVELDVNNRELAKDIAMHIAASKPLVIAPEQVPADVIAKEKEIYLAQAATSGKPQEIIEKMVAGRLKKYMDEVSLVGQPFVKDPDTTVGALLNKHRAKVVNFVRFEVGEGIEKPVEDFVEAVMSQIQGK